jgi:hypothetical protein
MYDTSACTHILNTTRWEAFFVSHAVCMSEGSVDDVGKDFGVSVGMGSKAGEGLDEVVV